MNYDALQDQDEVKAILEHQSVLEGERAPWETAWRDIDRRVNPIADGGFDHRSPGDIRGLENFDSTAIEGIGRFTAAIAGMTIPRNQRWHGLVTTDADLNKDPEVQRWCEHATDRLFQLRYDAEAGFEAQAHEDIRQTGSYGTAPFWIDERVGYGLSYKAIHLSEVWIDEDASGRVDLVHRKFERTARQAVQMFGLDALPDRIVRAYEGRKFEERFEFLHAIRPNPARLPGTMGPAGMPIESLYIACDEKRVVRHGGFHSMPMPVSRNATSPRDKYGRSPAMSVLGSIKTVNEMAKTILRAAHKQVDPALAFYDDGDISKLVTRPGGLNPGLVDGRGNLLVSPIPGGGDLRFGLEMLNNERAPIRIAFLEEVFKILTDPSDRMTATQVLEMAQKQGVLVSPFAGRYETEKLSRTVARELEIGMRGGYIRPMPPVMREARARAKVIYDNPLARMARAEEAAGFARWTELLVQVAPFDEEVIDLVDVDAAMRGVAEVLGVRASWIRPADEVAQRRAQREAEKQAATLLAGAPDAAAAALDLAKANEIGGVAA